eukprot:RCo014119
MVDLGMTEFLRYLQAQVLDFTNLFSTSTQGSPFTMTILTRLVSAISLLSALAKESTLVCVTAMDRFGVTPDRETDLPTLLVELLNIVLKTSLKPRVPLGRNRKAYEFFDMSRMDEKFAALLGPILSLVEAILVTLHKANDMVKRLHNTQPTAYRNTPLLEVLLKVYIALAYKAEYAPESHSTLQVLHSILLQWFWVPHKERAG